MTESLKFLKLQMGVCDIHKEQLLVVLDMLHARLPITTEDVENFDAVDKITIDSLAHRFSKLQSTLAEKVFSSLLESLGEQDVSSKSFIDILNRLEKLRILNNVDFWKEMRDTRNDISHDYPDDTASKAKRINECVQNSHRLIEFFDSLKSYTQKAGL